MEQDRRSRITERIMATLLAGSVPYGCVNQSERVQRYGSLDFDQAFRSMRSATRSRRWMDFSNADGLAGTLPSAVARILA